jgi:hypothetical protein
MLYAILCYNSEDAVGSWSKEYHDETMARLTVVQDKLARQGRLGPVARLLPTTAATTLRKGREELVIDGPFAETKEQLGGFWIIQAADLDAALAWAAKGTAACMGPVEVRPFQDDPVAEPDAQ